MVEDDVNDAELVRRTLKRGGLDCVAHRADTEQAFRRELSEFAPDVILSDFSMPLFDGMSALAIARHMSPDTPFIFVSGTIGEEYAIRALKNGATDYVLKSDLGRLVPSVERALEDTRIQLAQRQVQEALRHSELRFRLAASTGDVWDWTITSGEAYLSRQWKERLGYQDAEIQNDIGSWLDLLHPEDRDLVKQALKAHTKRREPYDIEFRARCRNGDYRWSHAKGQAVWDETGSASYMAGSVVDITERKQAELKVRRLNRLYAVLSGINALVVRVSQRDDLFREAARIAVEAGQFLLAWIGLTDTARQRLHVHAWQGVGATYLGDMSMSLAPDSADHGIVARAVHERRAVIVEDVMTDSRVPA
ncbi:MAG: PAS domain-containing protein, partial [Casimicrobiaceae bacterium]